MYTLLAYKSHCSKLSALILYNTTLRLESSLMPGDTEGNRGKLGWQQIAHLREDTAV